MKRKFGRTSVCFSVCSIVFLVIVFCSLQSFAVIKESAVHTREVPSPPAPRGSESLAPSSPFWRSFLWEALPVEWIRGTNSGVLLEAYEEHQWKPFFVDSRFEITPGGRMILDRLATLENDAIDPKPFQIDPLRKSVQKLEQQRHSLITSVPELRDSLARFSDVPLFDSSAVSTPATPVQYAMNTSSNAPPEARSIDSSPNRVDEKKLKGLFQAASEADARLTHAVLLYAREMKPFSSEDELKNLLGASSVPDFLKALQPSSPHYAPLREALARYRRLASSPGEETLRGCSKMRMGDSGNCVRILQKRLQAEGYYDGKISGTFDTATHTAVLEFQRCHMMDADGTVGQKTIDWLNLSYEKKADMVAQSMKLIRQSQTGRYDRYIRINIPQFLLEYYNQGKIEAVHRVIVGKASGKKVKLQGRWVGENQTPTLSSSIEQVVFNPRWYVTDRIRGELSDEIASDPHYLSRNGYVEMSSLYPSGRPRIFQMPGPTNPLGQVKFEFSNAYAVFLHDTPKKQLFQRVRRDFSHGCVRVDKARDLARLVLLDDQNPAAERTQALLEANKQAYVRLQQPVPIVIEYVPVSSNDNGQLIFCGDPYGLLDQETKPNA